MGQCADIKMNVDNINVIKEMLQDETKSSLINLKRDLEIKDNCSISNYFAFLTHELI